ncbi:MAG: CBS domain-containing protein [Candidatus Omnitrophica bacterium]|nr:CBS domain-containing protein [Candidatus Omnitrophota bacterium]
MSKEIPTVQKFMSYDPVTLDADKAIVDAENLMRDNGIRHLPIVEDGQVVGILSDRDIKLAKSIVQAADAIQVRHICQSDVYSVEPNTPIDVVVDTMADHQYGSAVVVQNGKPVGIFTTVDACRTLAEITRQRYH